jgi:CubicO group peptidase (beta-lactamase class C family)
MSTALLRSFLLILAVQFYTIQSLAQFDHAVAEHYFNEVQELRQLNGNMLLANEGTVVYQRSFGYADIPTQLATRPETRYNLASISKLFTATCILQLKEKGKLSLEDPVISRLPDFPYPDIKIRHLLTHTSGIADLELFEDLIRKYPDTVVTNKNIIPELKKWHRGLYFKPGDKFQYCNTEYSLLAMVVEKVSGLAFGDYLKKYLFKPAGMGDSYLKEYVPTTGQFDPKEVTLHIQKHPYYDPSYVSVDSIGQYKYTNYNCNGLTGQGNIISTTKDLLLFDKAYFGGKLLKPGTIEEAITPIRLNNGDIFYSPYMDTMHGEGQMSYGLGWEIFDQPVYGRSVGHGGFKFGLATFYCRNLARKQTIITFDNAPNSEFGRIITSSLALLNGKEPMVLRNKKSLVGLYGALLVKHGIDHALVHFNACKADTSQYYLSEWEMNELGYDLFYKSNFDGHKALALETFKIATLVFPDSFNTYDSYGQLLKDSGKKEEAILMYQKSVSLNPGNEDGKRILKELSGK